MRILTDRRLPHHHLERPRPRAAGARRSDARRSVDQRRRLRRPERGDPGRGQAGGAGSRLAGPRGSSGHPRPARAPGRRGRATPDTVAGILHLGGTLLGTTNRGDPFAYPAPNGGTVDRSDEIVAGYHELGLAALIGIGGDGSLAILRRLAQQGDWRLIGIPKTIDNDLGHTESAVGFSSAVEVATEAVDRLHVTAASHSRVMVLEVMGRDAGHIALSAGIAGGADVILIPEIPYALEAVCAKIEERRRRGRNFTIVVVAELVRGPAGETINYKDAHGQSRYGGVGAMLAHEISPRTEAETRVTVLGHVQRGGSPARSIACSPRRSGSTRSIWLRTDGSTGWWPGRTARWSTLRSRRRSPSIRRSTRTMPWCIPRAVSASASATSRMGRGAIAIARLIADIGGTNARFALTGPDGRPTAVQS